MITIMAIHPYIFNIVNLSKSEKNVYLNQLLTWCKFGRPQNAIILLDKQKKIEQEIFTYIKQEEQLEFQKQLIEIWKYINKNIYRVKFSSKQFLVNDACQLCFKLVDKNQPESIFLQGNICNHKHCKECFGEIINKNLNIQYVNNSKTWITPKYNYSDIPEKYNFESFIDYIKFKNLIKCCHDFTLYDKNIIPETSNIISEDYKYNLEKFIKLFKGFKINVKIITYIKRTQIQQCEDNIVKTINSINTISKSNNVDITFKVLIGEDNNDQYKEQLHNRYIFTNLINFSIDRGLDIINKTSGLNRSFDINIIDYEKAKLFQDYLSSLKQYKISSN